MPIQVLCDCGSRFQVRDEYAGKKGQCPTCGSVVQIPTASEPVVAATPPPQKASVPVETDFEFIADEPVTGGTRSGGTATWYAGLNHGLLGLTRQSGMLLLLLGLLLVLVSRGCDSTAIRGIAGLQAEYQLVQNEFEDTFDEDKQEYEIENLEAEASIKKLEREIEAIQEKDVDDRPSNWLDDTQKLRDRIDGYRDDIQDNREKIDEVDIKMQEEMALKRAKEWKSYEVDIRDAVAKNTQYRRWRAWMFLFGTVLLATGLLTLATTGDRGERMVAMLMIAILTFSLYIGGLAWMDTVVSNGISYSQGFDRAF